MRVVPIPSRKALRIVLLVTLTAALALTALFGLRSFRTLLLLQSAQQTGLAETSALRGWMTLRYVADTYRIDDDALIEALRLPPDLDRRTTLRSLAEQRGVAPFDYVRSVQAAVAAVAARRPTPDTGDPPGWLAWLGDALLGAVLRYGLPALAATLFLGAIGAPVPTGLAMAVAGSLAAQGHFDWVATLLLSVTVSLLGDGVGFGLGRWLGTAFLERRGRWIGYSPGHRARIEALFARWGAAVVLISRTLASHLSSVVSLLAGAGRFGLIPFLLFAAIGRVIWTTAYFALGFVVGGNIEAASGFLTNLSMFLFSVALAIGAVLALLRLAAPATAE
jgi:membrane protein DedA with SNARE-associated domain